MLAGKAPVKTVDAHEPCLLALQKLLAVGVAGAAVVEGGTGGAIIANLSASDLRCALGQAGASRARIDGNWGSAAGAGGAIIANLSASGMRPGSLVPARTACKNDWCLGLSGKCLGLGRWTPGPAVRAWAARCQL